MNDSLKLRLTIFFILLVSFCFLEVIIPKRVLTAPKKKRWLTNLNLSFLNTLILHLSMPYGLVSLAALLRGNKIGLLNILNLSYLTEIILSVVIFDLLIYFQHILSHKFPIFWRFHKIHHIDVDLDVSSGNRFHTIEIVFSFLYKSLFILLLGPSPDSILFFEIILNSMAMFNHSNINIPPAIDKVLRFLVITPDMHRIHHSVKDKEYNKNFGFNLSFWDFLLKTYKEKPEDGHVAMKIGLDSYRDFKYISLFKLLIIPFYTINDEIQDHEKS